MNIQPAQANLERMAEVRHGTSDHQGHAENGELVETTDFPFEEVFQRDEGMVVDAWPTKEPDAEAVVKALRQVLRWVFQNGMNHQNGLLIRTKLACWNLLPEMQESYTLTALAGECEQVKQSFGRWQDDFKERFPNLPNPHNHT